MRKILLATHGEFAAGILDSVRIIIGDEEKVRALCAYVNPEENFSEQVKESIEGIEERDELVVLTDMLGGSVNNEFMRYFNRPGFYLVTGLNLPLLIALLTSPEADTVRLIQESLEEMKNQIVFCNELKAEEENEDF